MGDFNLALVIVAVVVSVLVLLVSVYLLVNYQHPDDANQAYFPKLVVVLGITVAVLSILMLPADVANRQACRKAVYNGACSLTLPMKTLWLVVYIVDAVLVFLVIPFAMFYYEGDQDKSVGKRLKTALIWVVASAVVCGLILGILYVVIGKVVSSYAASSSGPPAGDESRLVQQLRGRISRMEKDLLAIHAMVAVVKKKGELAIEAEQYTQKELLKATESLNFICLNEPKENKRVHDRVNALSDLSQPHGVFWTNRSKADAVVKFQDRVEQVHGFFDTCRASLAMVWGTLFPLNPLPLTLLGLLKKFKDAAEVRTLVRNQLLAGAEVALAFVQARYPTLDLELIAKGSVDLHPYYPIVKSPAAIVIDGLERGTEADLQA